MQKRYNNYTYYPNNIASSLTINPFSLDLTATYLGGNDWYKLYSTGFDPKTLDAFITCYVKYIQKLRDANQTKNGKLSAILVMAPGSNTASAANSVDEMNFV